MDFPLGIMIVKGSCRLLFICGKDQLTNRNPKSTLYGKTAESHKII